MKKIIIADDHEMILDGLEALLQNEKDISIVAKARNGQEVLDIVDEIEEVDVVLLDINMPVIDGIEVTRTLKSKYAEVKILILSMYNRIEFVRNLMNAGADGYILKNSGKQELIDAINAVHIGNHYFSNEVKEIIMESFTEKRIDRDIAIVELTEREKEVVRLITQEKSTMEIADLMCLSSHTINSHRKKILSKLGLKNATGIFRYAIQTGIVKGFDL